MKKDVKRNLRISLKDLEKERTQLEPNLQLLEVESEIELNKLRNDLSKALKLSENTVVPFNYNYKIDTGKKVIFGSRLEFVKYYFTNTVSLFNP